MQRAIIIITLILLSFGLKAQVYQAMPQAGYGPVKRMLFDSVLTIPLSINGLKNITGGRDAGQIRYNVTDSGLYVYSGYQWIKANLDSTNISNRINGKLNISDTAAMLLPYMKYIDTLSLSNRINLRVKYSDTAAMLLPYLRKLDTASLSRRIDKKQDSITLTTNFKSGAATLIGATLNIPKYSDTLSDAYVPYTGATKDVDLGAYKLSASKLKASNLLEIQNQGGIQNETLDYTSLTPFRTGFSFYTGWMQGQTTFTQSNIFNYANTNLQNNTRSYNLPVRNGTIALVEDTVNLSDRINLKADKATTLTINSVTYDLSQNRTWTIPVFDSTSISNRINLKLNISDTASMLSPYLRKADTSSLSNRINLRVKYSDTAAMLSPYLKAAVTSVGLSMPSAFTVTNSPVTSTGTLTVTGAGNTSQYVDGTGALQTMQGIVTEVETLVKEVYNETGATLTKGTVVFINGGQGNLPTVTKAVSTYDSLSAQTFGLVKADIGTNSNGYVIVIGDLNDMPTNAYANGTQLYLSTTAGQFTSTKQYAPSHLVYVGIVTRSHPTQGVISVKIQNGYEMDELHNVSAQSPSNNSLLQYKTATSLWTKVEGTTSNIAEGTNLYYTDARVSNKMNYTDTVSLSNRINTKADALSGTTNTVPKFTSATTIGNSNIKDNGNAVSISTTAGSNGALQVGNYNGNILMNTTNSSAGLIFQNTSSSNKLWDISSYNNDLNINESNVALAPPRMIFKAGGDVIISSLVGIGSRMVVADASGVLSTQAITGVDTTSLSNRINLKLNISDTASMLSGYQSAINSKQAQLNGTGFVKASGTTISYDNSTYYLASNPNGYTSNTGTVTSVATGLGLSGGTITTSGTLLVDTASASILSRQRAANTYATTSSLSGYLPLTGGTLTGALNGTTLGLTGALTSSKTSGLIFNAQSATTGELYTLFQNSGGQLYLGIDNSTATVFGNGNYSANLYASGAVNLNFFTNNTRQLTIASTGAASFSSSVTSSQFISPLNLNNSQLNTGSVEIQSYVVNNSWVGDNVYYNGTNFTRRNAGYASQLYFETSGAIAFFTSPSAAAGTTPSFVRSLTLTNTGAATFSSSVTSNVNDGSAGFNSQPTTTTNSAYNQFLNADGYAYIGKNSSTGGNLASGSAAYAFVMSTYKSGGTSAPIQFAPNNSIAMTITSGGNVGINYAGDASTRLAVFGVGTTSGTFGFLVANSAGTTSMWVKDNGDGYLKASAWAYGSDIRMKENISDVKNGLDMVLKMKPKHFDYINGQKDNLGFIAQDVQEIIPQAVSISDEKTGMLALKTDFLVPYLTKAVQELSQKLDELSAKNEALIKRIETLENK